MNFTLITTRPRTKFKIHSFGPNCMSVISAHKRCQFCFPSSTIFFMYLRNLFIKKMSWRIGLKFELAQVLGLNFSRFCTVLLARLPTVYHAKGLPKKLQFDWKPTYWQLLSSVADLFMCRLQICGTKSSTELIPNQKLRTLWKHLWKRALLPSSSWILIEFNHFLPIG